MLSRLILVMICSSLVLIWFGALYALFMFINTTNIPWSGFEPNTYRPSNQRVNPPATGGYDLLKKINPVFKNTVKSCIMLLSWIETAKASIIILPNLSIRNCVKEFSKLLNVLIIETSVVNSPDNFSYWRWNWGMQ